MLTKAAKSQAGFTLVEALVAGLILVIGILGGVSVFDSSRRESNSGERLNVAQAKAEAELERMRDIPYAQLATNSGESWISSGQDGDPAARVISGTTPKFKTTDSGSETLVRTSTNGIKPYSPPETVTFGGADYTMSVYRFVTWRDVECRVLDLAPLKARYNGLINALITQTTNGTSYATTLVNSLIGSLLSLPLINGTVGGTLKPALQTAQTNLASVQTKLNALLTAVNNLNEIDPCDMDLTTLSQIDSTLGVLKPALTTLDNALLNAKNATACVVIVGCSSATKTAYDTAITQINAFTTQNYASQVNGLVTSLGQLSSQNHPYNTKRITVAIVLDSVNGSGPFEPVWASSVVSDPNAGLLSG